MANNDGLKLREFLRSSGISRSDAANVLGYSPSSLSRKFNDKRFSDELRKRVLEAYGLDLSKDTNFANRVIEYAEAVKKTFKLNQDGIVSDKELEVILKKLKEDLLSR